MNKKNSIDQYINGELSGEELKDFEKELQADPQLAEDVKLHREIDRALKEKDVMELHAQLNGIYENIRSEITNSEAVPETKIIKHKTFPVLKIRWQYAAAAGIAILIGIAALLFFTLRPAQNERLYAQYFKPYDASSLVRSGSDQAYDKFGLAMNEYNSENFKKAFTMFNELSAADPSNMAVLFFKGISAMELNKFEDASTLFEKIISDNSSLYTESAEWYFALCYLKKSDLTKTKKILIKIAESDSYYKKDAASILRNLN